MSCVRACARVCVCACVCVFVCVCVYVCVSAMCAYDKTMGKERLESVFLSAVCVHVCNECVLESAQCVCVCK